MSSTAPVPTVHADRARRYPRLENDATLGTVCEYQPDGWSWVVITDLPDRTWGDVFDETDDERTDEKVVRFLNLEALPDAVFARFEDAVGCYEHADLAREYSDSEGAGNYMRRSDFQAKFRVLGPIHPDARTERESE
ncbi:hypothetical protein [Natrinema pallidum]|uniref:Uncharacterized protein n=1 Tax=Natrinema pallidum TaxID=69527 RepID=A0A4P9TJU7_9EURY|nr:hypothetical protein [Natrinema pallidum]QCW05278.1 hypothetical protein FGF80_18720 [Natrinema pallidum]